MSVPKTGGIIRVNPFDRQWEDVGADVIAAVERVGKSGRYILGPEVAAFESKLARFVEAKHAVGCASGLDAIEIGLRALGLRRGEEVLTTPLSAFATTLAIIRAGGAPVFVDTDETGLLDLERARQCLEERPALRFFVPVHLFGQSLDLGRLQALKDEHGLQVVEDCAQALGASWCDRQVGGVGQVAALSLYPTKNLGALGDAGAVFTNDDGLADEASAVIVKRLVLPVGVWYRVPHEPNPRFADDAGTTRDAARLDSSGHDSAARGVAEPDRGARG